MLFRLFSSRKSDEFLGPLPRCYYGVKGAGVWCTPFVYKREASFCMSGHEGLISIWPSNAAILPRVFRNRSQLSELRVNKIIPKSDHRLIIFAHVFLFSFPYNTRFPLPPPALLCLVVLYRDILDREQVSTTRNERKKPRTR